MARRLAKLVGARRDRRARAEVRDQKAAGGGRATGTPGAGARRVVEAGAPRRRRVPGQAGRRRRAYLLRRDRLVQLGVRAAVCAGVWEGLGIRSGRGAQRRGEGRARFVARRGGASSILLISAHAGNQSSPALAPRASEQLSKQTSRAMATSTEAAAPSTVPQPAHGVLPKIGIRPGDRRAAGRPRVARETDPWRGCRCPVRLRHPSGPAVECVIADAHRRRCRGRAAPSFAREGVGVNLTVTPLVLRRRDDGLDPLTQGGVGFNGTQRPGAVYLAAVLAGHNQKGCPSSPSTAATCRTPATSPSRRCEAKLLQFAAPASRSRHARQGVPVARRHVDGHRRLHRRQRLLRDHLGMRVETVDMVDSCAASSMASTIRRSSRGPGVGQGELPGRRDTSRHRAHASQRTRLGDSVKMALITRDLMVGNPRLASGLRRRSPGHNAILGGFQGQRQWTDHFPNGDSWKRSSTALRLEWHPPAVRVPRKMTR